MKILLFGKDGQIGWELQRSLAHLGEVTALDKDSRHFCGNFENLSGISKTIRKIAPDVIVNAAAYTAVDQAESEPELALTVNARAVAVLAEEAKHSDALLVHYSTDYVFDGSGDKPWIEVDETKPLNIYGATKLKGDLAIISSGCRYLILRSSWIYSCRGNNFVKSIIHLAQKQHLLTVVDDQFGAPTSADLLAKVTARAVLKALDQKDIVGLYHVAAGGTVSRHGYATFIVDYASHISSLIKVKTEEITPISSELLSAPAKRPLNSRLDTTKFRNTFNLALPEWQLGLEHILSKYLATRLAFNK